MERKRNRLTTRQVATAKCVGVSRKGRPKEHERFSDGGNLYLSVTKSGTKSWVFLCRARGRTHEMGLGSAALVTLQAARKRAHKLRVQLSDGYDPLDVRRAAQRAANRKTFGEVACELIASKESSWRNHKHRAMASDA